jgi:hypothetical protein
VISDVVLSKDVSGTYYYHEMVNDKPAYKHQFKDFYLFFAGWWKFEVPANYKSASASGFIKTNMDTGCPEEVGDGNWIYYESNLDHSNIKVTEGKNLSWLG